jgi:membrane protein
MIGEKMWDGRTHLWMPARDLGAATSSTGRILRERVSRTFTSGRIKVMGRWLPSGTPRDWWERLWTLGRRVIAETLEDRITTISGSLAFHWFLAIFPAAVALIGLLGLVGLSPSTLHSILHGAAAIMPSQTSQIVASALREQPSKGTSRLEIVLGIIVAVWSATEAMAALQIGLDVAFEVKKDRGFLGRRAMAVPLLLLTLVLGVSASSLLVLGDPIRSLLPAHFPLVAPAAGLAWTAVRWLGAMVLVMLLLSAYYAIGPRRDHFVWRWITSGSIVATISWLAASAAFSEYLRRFGHDTRSYGAFADVAVLLLWLYITGLSVLVGAEVNCEVDRLRTAGTKLEVAVADPEEP